MQMKPSAVGREKPADILIVVNPCRRVRARGVNSDVVYDTGFGLAVAARRRVGAEWHWLPNMDLNHDKQIQSLLCYHYTIRHRAVTKLKPLAGESSR